MWLVEKLRKLKDFRDNILGYCAYFYVLEYLVRFKGHLELQDRLEWVTELLYDYFLEYGKNACYSETLQGLDNYILELHMMPEKQEEVTYYPGCTIRYNTVNINNRLELWDSTEITETIRDAYYLLVHGKYSLPEDVGACSCKTKDELDAVFNTAFRGFYFMLSYSTPLPPKDKCVKLIAHLLLHPLLRLPRKTEITFANLIFKQFVYDEFYEWLNLSVEDVSAVANFLSQEHKIDTTRVVNWARIIRRIVYYEKAKRDLNLTDREILSCLADFFGIEAPLSIEGGGWTGGEGGRQWRTITLTVRDIIDRRIDKVHHIDILWHLEHKRTWLNRILSPRERVSLKNVLDAKFRGDFNYLYKYALEIDKEIGSYKYIMTLAEVSKSGWAEKEQALARDVELALELGIAPV